MSAPDRLAGRLALLGASLGVVAGLIELILGPSLRDWVGDKQDTTRLGLTTVLLSAVALGAAIALRRPGEGLARRRVVIALAIAIPAPVCFTTVGRLWYLPGILLLAAGGLVAAGTRPHDIAAAFDQWHWRAGLVALCGAYYAVLGATALGVAGLLGVLGGALIWAAIFTARRSPDLAQALLLAGALPFAAATWWSVVTPVVAVLAIVIGHGLSRASGPGPGRVRSCRLEANPARAQGWSGVASAGVPSRCVGGRCP